MSDWYAPLRQLQSLGQTAPRPGSLAGLHAARQSHLGQFFTTDALARFIWQLITPAIQRAQTNTPAQVALFDNAVGTGRLFQFADPDAHYLAGADIHDASLDALITACEAAGFDTDFLYGGMEQITPSGFGIGLINPPYSLTLSSPTLSPYPCTHWGKFGPHSHALSHQYALYQALDACDIVVAILPRSYTDTLPGTPDLAPRLRAIYHAPRRSFAEQNTDVDVSVCVFDIFPTDEPASITTLASLGETVPDLGLTCRTRQAIIPRLSLHGITDDTPTVTLPVTGNRTVRVTHNQRRIILKFACGLTQAKVMNGILDSRIDSCRTRKHRYPQGLRYTGEGKLDIEVYLAQPDALAAFEAFIDSIRVFGGDPEIDPGLTRYLQKRIRRHARQYVPLRHVVYDQHGLEQNIEQIRATAVKSHVINPEAWGSPVIQAGDTLTFTRDHSDGVFRV
jgi:hypothetical protein